MVREKRERGILILSIQRLFLDERDPEKFEQVCKPYLSTEKRIVLDLNELDFIDSSHLAALVVLYKRASQAGAKLVFTGIRQTVRDTLFVTRLDKVFALAPSRKEALDLAEEAGA
jgi:anti-sigma B factor antagonist